MTKGMEDVVNYGGNLMKGEAQAMASFVADGKRIPRRGEIGLTPEQIKQFEDDGFVMSGSRHGVINAVRLRKESQIYNAQEAAIIAKLNREERERQEQKLLKDLSSLVKSKVAKVSESTNTTTTTAVGNSSLNNSNNNRK